MFAESPGQQPLFNARMVFGWCGRLNHSMRHIRTNLSVQRRIGSSGERIASSAHPHMASRSSFAFAAPAFEKRQSRVKATITALYADDRGSYGSHLPKLGAIIAPPFR